MLDFPDDNGAWRALVGSAQSHPNLKYLITDQFADGSSGPIRKSTRSLSWVRSTAA